MGRTLGQEKREVDKKMGRKGRRRAMKGGKGVTQISK
jgi:hypothetical protein